MEGANPPRLLHHPLGHDSPCGVPTLQRIPSARRCSGAGPRAEAPGSGSSCLPAPTGDSLGYIALLGDLRWSRIFPILSVGGLGEVLVAALFSRFFQSQNFRLIRCYRSLNSLIFRESSLIRGVTNLQPKTLKCGIIFLEKNGCFAAKAP